MLGDFISRLQVEAMADASNSAAASAAASAAQQQQQQQLQHSYHAHQPSPSAAPQVLRHGGGGSGRGAFSSWLVASDLPPGAAGGPHGGYRAANGAAATGVEAGDAATKMDGLHLGTTMSVLEMRRKVRCRRRGEVGAVK